MADYPVSIDRVRRELIKLRDEFRVPFAKDVVNMSIARLEGFPQMDAVPVVRCRECKFRGFDFCPMCHDEYTYEEDDGGDYYTVDNTTDDGFCHKGAKMDAEENA